MGWMKVEGFRLVHDADFRQLGAEWRVQPEKVGGGDDHTSHFETSSSGGDNRSWFSFDSTEHI
jgi:hypothetical protein